MLSRHGLRIGAQAWKTSQLPVSMASMPVCHFNNHTRSTEERLKLFKEVTETYYTGAQRDLKNWPTESCPEHTPPTRLLVVPDSWFEAIYKKSGVSGPYMLGIGALTFMFSKELIGWDEHLVQIMGFSGACYFIWSKVHKGFSKMTELETRDHDEEVWYGPKSRLREQFLNAAQATEKAIKEEEGQKYMYETFRENVDLQLEAKYRKRLQECQVAIKKRLDYQLEKENALKSFQHAHMTSWIVDNVIKGITPQQENAAINQCITDLKAIAANQ